MKHKLLITLVAVSLLMLSPRAFTAEKGNAKAELQELVGKIQAKLKQDKKTEKELSEELKEFDALLARHKGEKTDEVAEIHLMKAMLYLEIFDDTEKGLQLVKQLKSDFPETAPGKQADQIVASIQKQAEVKKIQRSLTVGAKFPDFDEKDLAGKPLSVANYKGKVVLIDFWATWCGPCVRELPSVLKTYEKHHAKGFEIIGISLDKDEKTLTSFIKKQDMPWPQYFDGLGWANKLAQKYGVSSIPATYLVDGEGKILAKDLRGDALEAEVAKNLSKP